MYRHTIKPLSITFLLVLLVMGCKEDQLSPVKEDDTPPGSVANPKVENMPGKARITYELPDDNDLLYVKAEYQINDQTPGEAKSSYYKDYVMVEGFGDTTATQVKLYAIDRSENVSEPVTVTVKPLIPPILTVFESLELQEDFGGINITFQNQDEADVVISTITRDSLGEWVTANNFYTSRSQGNYSVRGYEAEQREFGIYVRDRWENRSDTMLTQVTPWYEELMDKTKFEVLDLPGDAEEYSGSWDLDELWDDDIGDGYHTSQDSEDSGFPLHFNFDLGVKAKLSRMKLWQRQGDWIYTHGNPKTMEIWGSNDPAGDGSYEGWTKLGTYESFKPSGLPSGEYSNEDAEYAGAGEEVLFPLDSPAVRYIRFKVIESWTAPPNSPNGFVHFMEVNFWGQIEEE